ncbi:BTAD domain-containing putative transcriptional regulator [Plantactinospora soyae]|uniref:ATPase/DNA-binding SARP family transcriptional activator n=1 Tax=Plantactinospora soyae TaxID=1544732 RepID=A0A927QXD7_9ACTN|nr:BTAD domain-containing putative transcriptional regulator [Plantactinospora soyae]MBE1485368.1 putative ATPase/DNA-binding SARP family transcriptional activator [Plantactinospora soyae]
MRLGILGTTEVRLNDGTSAPIGGPRLRGLLALLALNAGHVVTTERLIDGLYGEDPPQGAANALQAQVSRLRRVLRSAGPGELIEFHPAGYRLAIDAERVDAARFERLMAEGQRMLTVGDHERAASRLREAIELWRGPALADALDAPFAQPQATRLEELRVAAVEDRVEAELALGRNAVVVALLPEVVAAHPLRERPRGQLMRALHGAGRQAEALAVYQDIRVRLADELGADPSPDLVAAHLAVLRSEPAPATVPVGLAAGRTAPPAQLTSFVGRADDLVAIGTLLRTERLVTLAGPGGTGKTRLAIEVCRQLDCDSCYVDLATLNDGTEVPQALVSALGLRESGLLPPAGDNVNLIPQLVLALADQRLLLLFDNCEHVIDAVARLVHQLLAACAELRVLATSRESLGITGEALYQVPQLGLAPPGTPPAELPRYPAIRLFANRAAAVRPDFAVDDTNGDAVARICTALDGLPLAIELAAARLRALTVAEIETRLDDRLRLLSRGSRTAAPRHQTLRAVVGWSWDLLDPAERTLARRLTVFAGGTTLESAARVCGLPEDDVDELLVGLVDKSLLEHDNGRYRMLDTVRAFGVERLVEAGEEDRLRRAHADYFLELTRTAAPYLRDARQIEWLTRLVPEHRNIHAALHWAVTADSVLALRLVAAATWYWWLRGLRADGAALAAKLLDTLGPQPPADLDEEYVLCVAKAAVALGSALPAALDRAESVMAAIERPLRQPATMVVWAVVGGPARTRRTAHEEQIRTDPWSQAVAHLGQGYQCQFRGDLAGAERELTAGLAGFRALGDRWGIANVLDALAQLANWRGDWPTFHAYINEAIEFTGQLAAVEEMADLLFRRAEGLVRSGDLTAGQADYERAAEFVRRAGARDKLATAHHGFGEIARLRGDLAEARRHYQIALDECGTGWYGDRIERVKIHLGLARIAEAVGRTAEAEHHLHEALDSALTHSNIPVVAEAVEVAAGIALLHGDGGRAALLLGASVALRGTDSPRTADFIGLSESARNLVGVQAHAAAFARGSALSRDAAVSLVSRPPADAPSLQI